MLAYAANLPQIASRRPSPNALLAIVAAHVALIAVVMSAKMEFDRLRPPPPIIVDTIPAPKPPPSVDTKTRVQHQSTEAHVDRTPPIVTTRPSPTDFDGTDTPPVGQTQLAGAGTLNIPQFPPIAHVPAKFGPQLATPSSELRPPYPASKIASEEEALLRLRLTIDANGKVTAVDAVGPADRAFLDAARRHLIAHWRYKPATEDGRAVSSSAVITLRFQLDG